VQFDEGNFILFCHILISSSCFCGQFSEQVDRVSMGSLLSPVIASFFMEDFEEVALSRTAYKRTCWFCHVDHTHDLAS